MLHEVLLALSGHASPIFNDPSVISQSRDPGLPLLTPAESALLQPLGLLATLHRDVRAYSNRISASHPSTICRAVSNAIVSTHLAQFQQKIIDVEKSILTEDSGAVGAYGIVPLASIVSQFEDWRRRMEWYWDLVCFILPVESKTFANACTGCRLIDKLRQDALTGYPDIEESALSLSTVAERAWLRQLATWILYGELPEPAPQDFFVHSTTSRGKESGVIGGQYHQEFALKHDLVPYFVVSETASSILFIGRSLHQLQNIQTTTPASEFDGMPIFRVVLSDHLQQLSKLQTPISPIALSAVVRYVRQSLSRNLINKALPIQKTIQTISYLREFMLLGREDFAETLVRKAEDHLHNRRTQAYQGSRDLAGIVMKEAEVASVLSHTWTDLESHLGLQDTLSDELEWAREHLHLHVFKPPQVSPIAVFQAMLQLTKVKNSATSTEIPSNTTQDRFNDFILATPTILSLTLPSHHDLFFSHQDLQIYSTIHNYLLSIRRAHIRLTDLWRRRSLRRAGTTRQRRNDQRKRTIESIPAPTKARSAERDVHMRAVWSTIASSVSLLSALGQYLNGEVVEGSWKKFNAFVSSSQDMSMDPEILAQAHQRYLLALNSSLLLADSTYTRILRAFLTHCDQLLGYVDRLQVMWPKIDALADSNNPSITSNLESEEADIKGQLSSTMKQIQGDIEELIKCLRVADDEGLVAGRVSGLSLSETSNFVPWGGAGVERLLMKIDQSDAAEADNE